MKTIAVLITVHNRVEFTLECLKNIFNQTVPDGFRIAVYLTDDGSTDDTTSIVRAHYPDVRIIKGDGELYWNRGMIKCWERAAADSPAFYLWLNNDTSLLPGAMMKLLEKSAECKDASVVVGWCVDSSLTTYTYGLRDKDYRLLTPQDYSEKAVTFNGNIVLVPSKVYDKLGMLDKGYRHSLGDFDYGLRATRQRIGITGVGEAVGICDTHTQAPQWCDSTVPLGRRWKNFMSPLGANPFEYFRFKRRHYGIMLASVYFASSILHVLMPGLWNKK